MAGSIYETVLRIRTELGDSLAQFDKLRAKVKSATNEVKKSTSGAMADKGAMAQSGRLNQAQKTMKDVSTRPILQDPTQLTFGQDKKGKKQLIKAEHDQYVNLEGVLHKVRSATQGMGHSYQDAAQSARLHTTTIRKMEPQISHVATTMKENGKVSTSVSNTYRMLGGQYQLVGSRTSEVSRSHERFQMHLLSVMFFGMAVQRMFMGYIKQVLQLTGVTDMLSATITLFLLPALLPITPEIYNILGSLMELDPEVRKMLGLTMIATAIIGTALMLFGMVGLGIQGIKIALIEAGIVSGETVGIWAMLKGVGARVFGWIMRAVGGLSALSAIIILVLIGAVYNAKDIIWGGIKHILEGIWNILKGIFKILAGIFDIVWGIITGDTDKIKGGIHRIISGITDIIVGGLLRITLGVMEIMMGVIIGLIRLGHNLIKVVVWVLDEILSFIFGLLTKITGIDFIGYYKDIVDDIDSTLFKPIRNLFNEFVGFLTDSFKDIQNQLDDFTDMIDTGNIDLGGLKDLGGNLFGLSFKDGGMVPGPKNKSQLAMVHGGETILPVGSSGGATVNLSINVDSPSLGSSVDVSDLADEISRSMTRELRRTKIL